MMKHTFQFAWTQTTRKVFSDTLYERQRRRWSAIHRAFSSNLGKNDQPIHQPVSAVTQADAAKADCFHNSWQLRFVIVFGYNLLVTQFLRGQQFVARTASMAGRPRCSLSPSTLSWLPLLSSISSAEPIYVMVVAVFNAIIITVTKQLRNWFGNVQHFEFVNDTRMASFLCRREKGGDCIQDLSLSVVKILLFNKSPITTPFVNKCQKWFSWLTKAWGWWGRWWVAGKVKLVTTGSTCLEAKLSYISLSEAFSRLFYFISSPRAFLQFELYYQLWQDFLKQK